VEVKQERVQRLLALQEELQSRHFEQLVGTEVEVLVESRNSKDPTKLKGRTPCWKRVLFPGDNALIGTLQQVQIAEVRHQTLLGI